MRASRWAAGCYVALIGVMAGSGGLTRSGRFYLAGIVLPIPAGLVALVSVYVVRGLSTGIGGLFTETRLPDGGAPAWPTTTGTVLDTALFTAAAVATMLLAERFVRRRRASRTT
ncbi:hypothetical protein ACIOJE_29230 [Kitasatospora sp. NPDC087861]|uniref:hypothetical protein n=1 Tax=Kitasatospora sp. NPDC087861 TaxID=3364070 RepID=UPI00382AC9E9